MGVFDLEGHIAVITGANRGIGLGLARGLVGAGAHVVLWSRSEVNNAAAVDELSTPGEASAVRCDVSSAVDIAAALEQTLAERGRVDSLFVNAGTTGFAKFPDLDLEEWRRVLEVNLDGAFLTAKAVAEHMIERGGGGAMVFVASVAARLGLPYNPHYAASKGGVRQLARSLAVRLAPHEIRVNIISPGFVATAMTENLTGDARLDAGVKARIPLGRWGRPEDFAGLAVLLAGEAAPYMTGTEIIVDGGLTSF